MFAYNLESGILVWKPRNFNSLFANGWNTKYANKEAGVKNSTGYLCVSINQHKFLVHRVIWKLLNGTEPVIVDHIDGNRQNNKASNLRQADESLSQFNKTLKSGRLPRGVQPNKYRFMARLKDKYLGTYATPEEAHQVYKTAANLMYCTPPTSQLQDQ